MRVRIKRTDRAQENSPNTLFKGEVVFNLEDNMEYIVTENGIEPRWNYKNKCRSCLHRHSTECGKLYSENGYPLTVKQDFFCGFYQPRIIQVDDLIF